MNNKRYTDRRDGLREDAYDRQPETTRRTRRTDTGPDLETFVSHVNEDQCLVVCSEENGDAEWVEGSNFVEVGLMR